MDVNNQLSLILSKKDNKIWCLCSNAFSIADELTFSQKKLKKIVGSLVIFENNIVKKIVKIEKIELAGKNIFEKFFNFMTGTYIINTEFEEIKDITVYDVKKKLIDNINNQKLYMLDHFMDVDENIDIAIEKIQKNLNKAQTYKEIIYAFGCININTCLDGL